MHHMNTLMQNAVAKSEIFSILYPLSLMVAIDAAMRTNTIFKLSLTHLTDVV